MILCIDCGLTNGKALLLDKTGNCHAQVSFSTPLEDCLIDTHALRVALYQALHTMDLSKVIAINVSGHGNGIYAIGEKDVLPVGYSSMVNASAGYVQNTFSITAQSDWAGQPLPILAWLKDTQPEIYNSIRTVLFCKDLLRWFLTGSATTELTDASAAGLLNARTGKYDPALLALYGLSDLETKLPPLLKSDAVGGLVSQEAARLTGLPQGVPVYGGLFDVNSCMLGSGVIAPGTYSLIAGTWGINACACKELVESTAITQCSRFFGTADFVCIDCAPTSCSNLEWFSQKILGSMPYSQVNEFVAQASADEELLYLPYIYAPMDLPNAKGGFSGIKPHHGVGDLLRAVFEGIVFEHKYRLEKLISAGCHGDCAILSGGGAASEIMCQMFADVCGIPFRACKQTEAGALGGAILALNAQGVYPSLEEAVRALVHYRSEYTPNPTTKDYYEKKYAKFLLLRDSG